MFNYQMVSVLERKSTLLLALFGKQLYAAPLLKLQQMYKKLHISKTGGSEKYKINTSTAMSSSIVQKKYSSSSSITTTKCTTNGSIKNRSTTAQRYLAAFDFDHTVVELNTDTVIRDLLPPEKLCKELDGVDEKQGWNAYMAAVFCALHKHGITSRMIVDAIQHIPEVPGFIRLLKCLRQKYNFDLIIISDSNTIFINEWLQCQGLENIIKRVFTNPAYFDDNDLLVLKPYHHQTECNLSAANLCKGQVLEDFLLQQHLRDNIQYDRVIYVGDGTNDICPVTRLKVQDVACARAGYSLVKKLTKNQSKLKVNAELIIWETGVDLLAALEERLEKWQKSQSS